MAIFRVDYQFKGDEDMRHKEFGEDYQSAFRWQADLIIKYRPKLKYAKVEYEGEI